MKSVEINSSHNIVLQFRVASIADRILALVIDYVIIGVASVVLLVTTYINQMLYIALVGTLVFLYHLLFEMYNQGQTPGKKLMKIRVVSLTGRYVPLKSCVIRWVFRLLDITLTAGVLAILHIYLTPKGQRVGDVLADTAVVRIEHVSYSFLANLLNLDQLDYTPTYPQVTRYSDEDMLLVKEVLLRHKKHLNHNIHDLTIDLATKIRKDLAIPAGRERSEDFLKTILQDYIMLTR